MDYVEPIITIAIALVSSSVVAALIANRASYKSIAVEAITKERISWLDELRRIAEDFAIAAADLTVQTETEPSRTSKVDRLSARLELHLNPEGNQEKNIIQAGNRMISMAKSGNVDGFHKAELIFMLETRKLLKAEWNKAKAEAGVKVTKSQELP